jgi:hypothetical protein
LVELLPSMHKILDLTSSTSKQREEFRNKKFFDIIEINLIFHISCIQYLTQNSIISLRQTIINFLKDKLRTQIHLYFQMGIHLKTVIPHQYLYMQCYQALKFDSVFL